MLFRSIRTETNAQGVATVEITRDPSALDRFRHWQDYNLPDLNPLVIVDVILDLLGGLPSTEIVTTGLTTPAAEPQTTVGPAVPTGVAA